EELSIGDSWDLQVVHLGAVVGATVASSNTVEIVSPLGAMQLNGDANDEVEEDVDVEFSFVGTPITDSTLGFQWLVDPDGAGGDPQRSYMLLNFPMNTGTTQIDVSGNNHDGTVAGGMAIFAEYSIFGGSRYD